MISRADTITPSLWGESKEHETPKVREERREEISLFCSWPPHQCTFKSDHLDLQHQLYAASAPWYHVLTANVEYKRYKQFCVCSNSDFEN